MILLADTSGFFSLNSLSRLFDRITHGIILFAVPFEPCLEALLSLDLFKIVLYFI